jgi:hypothetical protein
LTFRLTGSLPISVVKQWNLEREWFCHLAQTNPNHYDQVKHDFDRVWFTKFERLLDQATLPNLAKRQSSRGNGCGKLALPPPQCLPVGCIHHNV